MKCHCIVHFGAPIETRTWEERPLEEAEVMLRVKAAGVCHSDVHIWEGSYDLGGGRTISFADRGLKLPLTPGHETVGIIHRRGPQAEDLPTDRNYLIFPWIGCNQCPACANGKENLCSAPRYLGVQAAGGYADYIIVPDSKYLIDIGDLDPAIAAPLACSGLTTYSALNQIGSQYYQAAPIVIMGAGGLGLMALQLVKALNGAGAIVVDIDPVKRQAALDAGALAVVDPSATDAFQQITNAMQGKPLLGVLDTVGAPQTLALGVEALGKGGKLIVVGLFGGATPLPNALIPIKALTIQGSYVGTLKELRDLMTLARTGKIQPIPVTRRPLSEAADALLQLQQGQVVGRQVLVP